MKSSENGLEELLAIHGFGSKKNGKKRFINAQRMHMASPFTAQTLRFNSEIVPVNQPNEERCVRQTSVGEAFRLLSPRAKNRSFVGGIRLVFLKQANG